MNNFNDTYDIAKAFQAIEEELIASMIRNLDRHRAEEEKEGYRWTQWQAEQLTALEEYKKRNEEKYGAVFNDISKTIPVLISMQRAAGHADQEITLLKAAGSGAKIRKRSKSLATDGVFFKVNDRKINALIDATKKDFSRAEHAMLRYTNDQYRKIIFNAQMYAATGATYEKAVDMATKDFLSAGINCIEYKNGARHTITDYCKMAIQTANKRAYLTGEGESRRQRGIHTVIINKRTQACPKCLKWVGKVLVDDVWSGGTAKEAEKSGYPLMSQAIAAGLYH